MKLLIVTAWAPPMVGGGPLVLSSLLKPLPSDSYAFLTADRPRFVSARGSWLPASYHFLGESSTDRPAKTDAQAIAPRRRRLSPTWLRRIPFARAARDVRDLLGRSQTVRRQAIELIRKHGPTDIVATSDDGVFLLGAYRAAKATKTDLTVLLLDVYAGNNYSWVKRLAARLFEGRLLRSAKTVIVTNEATRAHYSRLHGINAVVLSHSAPARSIRPYRRAMAQSIVFAGSIYWAQRDAIQDLVSALSELPMARLTLLTDASEAEIRRLRGGSTQVDARYVPVDEVLAAYGQADVLFLPLSFGSRGRDVIRTALPGKLPEYLAAGVPILVHAPADSFIAQDANLYGWGFVVDTPGRRGLVAALQTLFTDDDIRRRLVTNAAELVKTRHDEGDISEHFRRLFV